MTFKTSLVHRPRVPAAPLWAALVPGLLVAASFVFSPGELERMPVLCPFRAVTSRPCPGCGLARSFAATAEGRLDQALAFHPFGPLAFLAATATSVGALAGLATGAAPLPGRTRPVLVAAARLLAVLWFLFALVRLGQAQAGG